jgi:hypothetical protein
MTCDRQQGLADLQPSLTIQGPKLLPPSHGRSWGHIAQPLRVNNPVFQDWPPPSLQTPKSLRSSWACPPSHWRLHSSFASGSEQQQCARVLLHAAFLSNAHPNKLASTYPQHQKSPTPRQRRRVTFMRQKAKGRPGGSRNRSKRGRNYLSHYVMWQIKEKRVDMVSSFLD